MRFLNHSLAQEIVNRTKNIIHRNINVMNEKGVIIGSGDHHRIDSIHEGAVRVIETQKGFEITSSDLTHFQGVKAGINLPITFHDRVVGVIGITGEPEEVRNYGELVKMAAEMILQQAVLIDEIQWDERLKEELTSQLLHGTETLDSFYFERVERLGIQLDLPRIAIILKAENHSNGYKWLRGKLENDDLYVVQPTHIVVLKRIDITKEQEDGAFNKIKSWIQRNQLEGKMAIGRFLPSVEGIATSYQEALYTLEVGEKLHPDQSLYRYEHYKLAVFLAKAKEFGVKGELSQSLEALKDYDEKGDLLETLSVYVEENGDVNKAASRLFIHRNTLRYRLERISELTNKDPRKLSDLVELYVAILQYKIQ
ncbi:sugar diacid recognition domain-containing protein [Priestia flexa]|uniref:sugar diacid recognition domain-containing protein n=1 Tax=Priestia TaxID=2800373 RepID=UPI002ED8F91E